MKFRQGSAPAVLYRDGKKAWEFTAGVLYLHPFDPELYALLLERGAEPLEPPPQVEPVIVHELLEQTPAPLPEKSTRKRTKATP